MSRNQIKDGWDVLRLDSEYTGSCPCFAAEIDGTKLEGHCWRVCGQCDGCGLHYEGDRAVAERVKPFLDALNWYGEWTIQEGLRR